MDLERLEEILDQLSEITPGERDVRLAQLADGDAEFEREVSAVLAHYDAALRAESERAVEEIRDERYELLERLGAGAYGVVWLAQDRKLERKVALKIVRKLVSDSGVLKRVISEAQAVAATAEESGLERYVIGVHDIGRLGGDGPPYIAMEVLADDLKAVGDGRGLARSLRDDGVKLPGKPAYSMERSARIVAQAARGVASAHAREVVHRDVKPGNVLVTPTGRVAVVDFGLSVAVSADAAHERSEVDSSCSFEAAGVRVQGTAPYMAPEQARGGPADARSDVYALGATLYFLLTG
ncbi:MAG: serine/threonine-protein kinase, partial [Planctomycetota bacterium]